MLQDSKTSAEVLQRLASTKPAKGGSSGSSSAKHVELSPEAYLNQLVPGRCGVCWQPTPQQLTNPSPSSSTGACAHLISCSLWLQQSRFVHLQLSEQSLTQAVLHTGPTGLLPSSLPEMKLRGFKQEPGKGPVSGSRAPTAKEQGFLNQALSALLAQHSVVGLPTIRCAERLQACSRCSWCCDRSGTRWQHSLLPYGQSTARPGRTDDLVCSISPTAGLIALCLACRQTLEAQSEQAAAWVRQVSDSDLRSMASAAERVCAVNNGFVSRIPGVCPALCQQSAWLPALQH